MTLPVSGSALGCRPASLRSMMASRRCASATPLPPLGGQDIHRPPESGPRWNWAALMRATASAIAPSIPPIAPAIPHMFRLVLEGLSGDANGIGFHLGRHRLAHRRLLLTEQPLDPEETLLEPLVAQHRDDDRVDYADLCLVENCTEMRADPSRLVDH